MGAGVAVPPGVVRRPRGAVQSGALASRVDKDEAAALRSELLWRKGGSAVDLAPVCLSECERQTVRKI